MSSTTCGAAGIALETEWFAPHFEFRFPLYGAVDARAAFISNCGRRSSRGTCWAKKRAAGGTVRYVDSSVERLQVKVTGLTELAPRRHVQRPARAAASDGNGRRIRRRRALSGLAAAERPASDDSGARAARVRLVDTWNERSIGGCIYHVAHPGGRSFETFPGQCVRGGEPAPRAVLRHRPHARSADAFRPRSAIPDFPLTLDLRRPAPSASVMRPERQQILVDAESTAHRHPGADDALATARRVPAAARARPRRVGATPGGELRPHCDSASCDRSRRSAGTSSRRDGRTRSARIRENGVTYNIYGDPRGRRSAVGSSTWCRCSSRPRNGAASRRRSIQRTRLLNLILADLYGPQRCCSDGCCRRRWCSRNPAFLRPCHGIAGARTAFTSTCTPWIWRARPTASGGCWPTARRRRRAPGYALENRIVLSRSLPEAFRDCQVQRLASFFRAQRDTLTALAPQPRDHAAASCCSRPGRYNETYFEHAYLARYLGFTLVEGGDLTVRDRRVFIKTLDGLQPVDVIFRRLDDSFCDPLELRSDSSLGVAGLVEAARAGNVTIANALGSGVIETAAIMPFLPGLCRHLLGEELLLPSVADLVVRPAGRAAVRRSSTSISWSSSGRFRPQRAGADLRPQAQRPTSESALAAEMRARPDHFVAQEQVALSTAPVWHGHKLEPRPLVLRTYVAAAGDSYVVMPGGLTRVVAHAATCRSCRCSAAAAARTRGCCRTDRSARDAAGAAGGQRCGAERAGSDLPSRVADNLFWLGRYAERAEHAMRLLRSVVARLTDDAIPTDTLELAALLQVLVGSKLLPAALRASRCRCASSSRRCSRSCSGRARTPACARRSTNCAASRPSSATGCRSTRGGS